MTLRKFFRFAFALLLSIRLLVSQASDEQKVEMYKDNTVGGAALCLAKYEHYLVVAELRASFSELAGKPAEPYEDVAGGDSDFAGCRDSHLRTAEVQYKALSKTIRSKGKRDALKSVQVAFVAAMKGLEARPGETKGEFRRRQTDLRTRIDEAWARFEVEE